MAAGAAASLLALPSAAQEAFVEPGPGFVPPSEPEGDRSRAAIVQYSARGTTAEIEQNGRGQDAFVFQSGQDNSANIDLGVDGNSAGNSAVIVQLGFGLSASIDVDGSRNNGARGLNARTGETASGRTLIVEPPQENQIQQVGFANTADVDVTGDNNAFRISQTIGFTGSARNEATIEQRGEENVAVQEQQGTGNRANLKQLGNGHTAKQVQTGVGLESSITQMTGPDGEPAFIVHRQTGVGEAAGGSVSDFEIVQVGGPPLAVTQ
jgi:hypothetical protein